MNPDLEKCAAEEAVQSPYEELLNGYRAFLAAMEKHLIAFGTKCYAAGMEEAAKVCETLEFNQRTGYRFAASSKIAAYGIKCSQNQAKFCAAAVRGVAEKIRKAGE